MDSSKRGKPDLHSGVEALTRLGCRLLEEPTTMIIGILSRRLVSMGMRDPRASKKVQLCLQPLLQGKETKRTWIYIINPRANFTLIGK